MPITMGRSAWMIGLCGLLAACGGGSGSGSVAVVTPPVVTPTPTPTPANHAPTVAAAIPAQTATQDKAFSYAVAAGSFGDADGDALALSATRTDGSALPSWLTFTGGMLAGTPDFADAGSLSIRIQAADGRGGTASSDFALQVTQAPAIPISLFSYANFKSVGLTPQPLPSDVFYTDNARAYGDFAGHRRLDMFVASTARSYATLSPAEYKIYERRKDGTLVASSIRITGAALGCIVPRKLLVADYNGDGRPDAFVACHGIDTPPYPGEQSTVVLSQSDGSYAISKASADIGFFHGAGTIDANGDGKPDVIATGFGGSSGDIGLLINQGDGSFKRDPSWKLNSFAVYALEIVDVNEDGKPDLLLGGHEFLAPARLYLGNGTANFPSVTPIILPTLVGEEISSDFLITGTGTSRAIWVLRAGRKGADGGPEFTPGRVIQRLAWPGLTQTVPYRDTRNDRGLPRLIATTVNGNAVVSSDLADDLSTPLN